MGLQLRGARASRSGEPREPCRRRFNPAVAEGRSSQLPAFVFHQHATKQLCRPCKAKCILLKEITVIYPHILTEAHAAVEVELSCQVALLEPVCKYGERKEDSFGEAEENSARNG